jgi:hypothetical protein
MSPSERHFSKVGAVAAFSGLVIYVVSNPLLHPHTAARDGGGLRRLRRRTDLAALPPGGAPRDTVDECRYHRPSLNPGSNPGGVTTKPALRRADSMPEREPHTLLPPPRQQASGTGCAP